jgi:hypothetical protein
MAIVDGLTTLVAVKMEAGISDTSQDTLLEALITSCSSAIRAYLDREITRTTHTDELYSVNACQYLYLREYPIQEITSITLGGVSQIAGSTYWLGYDDALAGRLYRPNGWVGNYYTRGTFPDIYAGARDIKTTYISGWYLPADVTTPPDDQHYVAGDPASLPLAISYACNRAVVSRFRAIINQADGIEQYSEGGISTTWFGPESFIASNGGFDSIIAAMLDPWKRREAIA